MSNKHDPSLRSDLRDQDDVSQGPLEAMLRELGEVQRRVEPPSALQAAWKRKQFDTQRTAHPQPESWPWVTFLRFAGGCGALVCAVAVIWWLKQPLPSMQADSVSHQAPRQLGTHHTRGVVPPTTPPSGRSKATGSKRRRHPGGRRATKAFALSEQLLGIIRQCVSRSRRDVFATPALRRKQRLVSLTRGQLSLWLRISSALYQQPDVSSCLHSGISRRLKAAPLGKRPRTWIFVVRDNGRRPTVAFLDLQRAFRKGLRRLIRRCVQARISRQTGAWQDTVTMIFLKSGDALVSASSADHRRQVAVEQSGIDCIRTGLAKETFQGTSLPYQKLGLYAGIGYSLFWRVAFSSEHPPSLWVQPLRMERAQQTQRR